VAFHPNFEYVALAAGQEADAPVYIVAAALAAQVATACKLGEPQVLAKFPGDRLDRATFQHPFLDRSVLGVNADYVTADQGTGAVHTAPSHGVDDFYTGVRYGLDATTRVDNAGVIHVDTSVWPPAGVGPDLPAFEGKKVFAANPLIIELLKERGALLGHGEIRHSYPHCWRCHRPVIFRATEQWFIGLETPVLRADGSDTTFRQLTIEKIAEVKWDPAWGQERITNMIATRPDWCISRQRIWGVPIAVFLCTGCHAPVEDAALNARIVKLFEEHGAEAWHTTAVEELLGSDRVCAKCGAGEFRKETDILDVWFDSGSSWHAVAETDRDLKEAYNRPDRTVLYLEGGDQHRGWFHSSLLASVALRGKAPYTHVATAGWTLDELGRAMSKSLGNGVDPVEIAEKMGGEIVRLWVASIDFREDMAASENLMKRCADIYRKLRNTFKFLLGNLHEFEPAPQAVAFEDLEPLDKYMLARTRELTEQVLRWYEEFEFHRIYHAMNEFAIADLSAFYLDVLKDRMYTFAPSSKARRSAQTVLWKITETLTRLLAPILSFTADEVWDYLPAVEGREASVHLALFPAPGDVYPGDPEPLLEEWKQLFSIRDAAMLVLEEERQAKRIGKALEAKLLITTQEGGDLLLQKYRSSLKELFNVSEVELSISTDLQDAALANPREINIDGLLVNRWGATMHPGSGRKYLYRVDVLPTSGHKCARCWNFMPEVSNYGVWENVCTRCHGALTAMGVEPPTGEEVSA
jgi:isoleucyl-tRNA synthetase